MHFARTALIAIGLTFASTSHAAIQAERCIGCESDVQWEQVASQKPAGNHYLYNFQGGEIRLYRVTRVPNGNGVVSIGPLPWDVETLRLGVPPRVQATFDATTELWAISPNLAYSDTIPIDPSDSDLPPDLRDANAYDIVSTSSLRNHLENYIDLVRSNNQFVQVLQSVTAGSYVGIEFDDSFVTYTARFILTDGSSVVIRIDLSHGQGAYYVKGESRDSNGNSIPEPGSFPPNIYRFGSDPDGFFDWRNYVRDFLQWNVDGGYYCASYVCHQVIVHPSPSPLKGEKAGDVVPTFDSQPDGWLCECNVQ